MWHDGGDQWKAWFSQVRDLLVDNKREDGSWSDPIIGAEYATAVTCIISQTPNDYLPILQR